MTGGEHFHSASVNHDPLGAAVDRHPAPAKPHTAPPADRLGADAQPFGQLLQRFERRGFIDRHCHGATQAVDQQSQIITDRFPHQQCLGLGLRFTAISSDAVCDVVVWIGDSGINFVVQLLGALHLLDTLRGRGEVELADQFPQSFAAKGLLQWSAQGRWIRSPFGGSITSSCAARWPKRSMASSCRGPMLKRRYWPRYFRASALSHPWGSA